MIAKIIFISGSPWIPSVDEDYAEVNDQMLINIYKNKKLIRAIPLTRVKEIIYRE